MTTTAISVPAAPLGPRLPPDGRRHEYIYVACSLFGDVPIAELPLRNVQFSFARSKPGQFSADVQIPVFSRVHDYFAATEPGRHVIYVFRDGEPIWGGIIWKRTMASDERVVKIEGDTFDSYMYHRVLDQDLPFVRDLAHTPPIEGTDQIEMFRILWAHMSGDWSQVGGEPEWEKIGGIEGLPPFPLRTNANIQVKMDPPTIPTILRGRNFMKWDFRTYGEHLESLAGLRDGFEWVSLVRAPALGAPTVSGVERYIKFGYPRLGRPMSETGFIWEYPGNMLSYSWTGDADKAATSAIVLGSGEGDLRQYAIQYNQQRLDSGWPLLDVTYTHSTVSRKTTLDSHAMKYLRAFDPPIGEFSMTVHPDMPPTFGPGGGEHYFIGDEIGMRFDDDIINESGIRPEDLFVVIDGITVSPNDDGLEDVKPEVSLNFRNPYIGKDIEEETDKVPEDWPGPSIDTSEVDESTQLQLSYNPTFRRRMNLRNGTGGWGGSVA
jgi:hypothetical protein